MDSKLTFTPSDHDRDICKNCDQLFFHCECGRKQDTTVELLENLKLTHVVDGWEFVEVSHVKMLIEQAKRDLLSELIEDIYKMGSGTSRGNEVLSKQATINFLNSKLK